MWLLYVTIYEPCKICCRYLKLILCRWRVDQFFSRNQKSIFNRYLLPQPDCPVARNNKYFFCFAHIKLNNENTFYNNSLYLLCLVNKITMYNISSKTQWFKIQSVMEKKRMYYFKISEVNIPKSTSRNSPCSQ